MSNMIIRLNYIELFIVWHSELSGYCLLLNWLSMQEVECAFGAVQLYKVKRFTE